MFEELEKFILAELESRRHPGSSVAVVKGREIVWSKGFGYSDVEKGISATPETVYRCASVTKTVLTMGFLQLMEKGKFRLDDPVNDHLDVKVQTEFEKQPTIRDILTHHSGMPTRVPPIYYDRSEAPTIKEYLVKAAKAVQPPKRGYAYCNTGFAIVGHLIELFSGEPYDRYVKENVLKPLEMDSSDFDLTPSIEKSLAQGYERIDKAGEPLRAVKPYILGMIPQDPAGSLFSTVIDLAHFLIANMNGGTYRGRRILKETTIEEMHKLQASAGNSRSGMALSWFRNVHDGHVMLSHTGGMPGFTSHVAFYPELKIGICWLSNLNDGTGWRPPAPTALRIIAGEYPSFNPKTIQTVPDEWRKIIGTYGKRGQERFIRVKNGYLVLEGINDGELCLEKIDKTRYLVHGTKYDGYELTFEYDEEGNVKQFDVENEVIPRYVEEEISINESADLVGFWHGEYVHAYGFFDIDLDIKSATEATATDMEGKKVPMTDFKAELGRVTGTFKFFPPREYAGWGAGEFKVKLELAAINNQLKGLMNFWSKRVASRSVTSLTLSRV